MSIDLHPSDAVCSLTVTTWDFHAETVWDCDLTIWDAGRTVWDRPTTWDVVNTGWDVRPMLPASPWLTPYNAPSQPPQITDRPAPAMPA